MTVPLCKDCMWYEGGNTGSHPFCLNPAQPSTDLVHGNPPFCAFARSAPAANALTSAVAPDFSGCGPSGKLFKAKGAANIGE